MPAKQTAPSPEFIDSLPDEIKVDSSILKKKGGQKSTVAKRRKSEPVRGKVKGRRNHFTDEEKLNAVCVYAVSGNARRTAELTSIPEATIRGWKQTQWWNEIMSRVHDEQDEELNSKLTNLVDKAVEAVNDRIDHGDYLYDLKRGQLVRVPVKAKDLTVVTAIAIDKRELLRGKPTSRVEKVSTDEHLSKLRDDFRRFSLAQEVEQVRLDEIRTQEETADAYEDQYLSEVEEEDEEGFGETVNDLFGNPDA